MNVRTEVELDRIFAEFHEDRLSAHPRPLKEWAEKHPDLGRSFVLWATEDRALDVADLCPPSPDFESRSIEIGRNILQKIGLAPSRDLALSSLNDAARTCGRKPRELAQILGIGMSLSAKLNRRLIPASLIPDGLAERLPGELNVPLSDLRAYSAQPPSLAESAAYRSEGVPEAA